MKEVPAIAKAPTPPPTLQQIDEANKEDTLSDDGDLACSQALDCFEEISSSTVEPQAKIPKIDAQPPTNPLIKPLQNRLTLNLKRFAFAPPKKPDLPPSTSISNSNEEKPVEPNNAPQTVDKPSRNRIFCTPSDEESSQKSQTQEKPVKKYPFKLNLKPTKPLSPRPVLQQQNVNEPKGDDKSEHDSAYDSMVCSSSSLSASCNTFGSAAKTGKTPAIFPPSNGTSRNISDQDLSFLDNFEF